jgi:hypothetical protein
VKVERPEHRHHVHPDGTGLLSTVCWFSLKWREGVCR